MWRFGSSVSGSKLACFQTRSSLAFLLVMSRVMARRSSSPGIFPGKGTARVSSQRRVPFRPIISSSMESFLPWQMRSLNWRKASLCSGTMSEKMLSLMTAYSESASIISNPAAFIDSKMPWLSMSFTQSGVASIMARSFSSLCRSNSSLRFRLVISSFTAT